ncbi:MAG: hypothetical protein SOY60_06875 [Fusobacterium gastrosuis]|uniref:hypothetical protein n=1 Tax=Fusobacterium gastrosuis TaxID=1755100 RepID=UPI002A898C9E|nr:hypothetical protein [Fusobacterium gastrosuis]
MEKNYKPYTKDKLKKSLTILKNVLGLAPEEVKTHDLKNIEACKEAMKIIADKYAYKKYFEQINELEKELKLERDRANTYWEECREKEQKIKKLEEEIAKIDNCKALYKEIDKLNEEIEFKNKEIKIKSDLIKTLNEEYHEVKEIKYDFIREAQKNKTELELQKLYKKAFAGAFAISVIINILLVWGKL